MSNQIRLDDGSLENIYSDRDFEILLESRLGEEAAQWYRDRLDQVKENLEEVDDTFREKVYDQIDEVLEGMDDLRTTINSILTGPMRGAVKYSAWL